MVALVLVAHSPELLVGLRAMVAQAAPLVPVAIAGGTASGALGTNAPAVERALVQALRASGGEGVVVLIDLGSAAMAVEIALEGLSDRDRGRVRLGTGPIVEGAVLAAVESTAGASLEAVLAAANGAAGASKLPDGRAQA